MSVPIKKLFCSDTLFQATIMKQDIARFDEMYDKYFATAKAELAAGRKTSHWMWFIFPQIQGLGHSDTAVFYALGDLAEARTFLEAGCGGKMLELIQILLRLPTSDPVAVFGPIDAMKLRSSMTLFSLANPDNPLFRQVLEKYYGGQQDELTLQIVRRQSHQAPAAPADRCQGMLWGLVVGDCLGSPIQFTEKDGHPYITEMVPCPVFNTPAGYWTDDSSMAFCIMESVVRKGGYDLRDIARNFVRWYDEGFWSSLPYAFDVGGATSSAIKHIARGDMSNGEESSQGNGSIMRFAPSFLLGRSLQDRKILYEISDLTHNSQKVRETVDLMAHICEEHLQGKRTGVRSIYPTREEVNNSGWAVSTLQAALWAFENTESFEEGMIAAVNLGGDSDSIGAVFGQIAGAFYGLAAIPERWIDAVKDRAKIQELIDAFLATVNPS